MSKRTVVMVAKQLIASLIIASLNSFMDSFAYSFAISWVFAKHRLVKQCVVRQDGSPYQVID